MYTVRAAKLQQKLQTAKGKAKNFAKNLILNGKSVF
jgi:hypothetical protein